jgi:hypothetical protein
MDTVRRSRSRRWGRWQMANGRLCTVRNGWGEGGRCCLGLNPTHPPACQPQVFHPDTGDLRRSLIASEHRCGDSGKDGALFRCWRSGGVALRAFGRNALPGANRHPPNEIVQPLTDLPQKSRTAVHRYPLSNRQAAGGRSSTGLRRHNDQRHSRVTGPVLTIDTSLPRVSTRH